jgi:AMMECR1 domain-containing protein
MLLSQLCRKAGLPDSAWKEQGTQLLTFQAEVFSEGEYTKFHE